MEQTCDLLKKKEEEILMIKRISFMENNRTIKKTKRKK